MTLSWKKAFIAKFFLKEAILQFNVLLSFQMSVPRYSKPNTRTQRCLHKNTASKRSVSTEPWSFWFANNLAVIL